jgi:putative toxin-antitoxin system antitoxin component (TIGR02293 family)
LPVHFCLKNKKFEKCRKIWEKCLKFGETWITLTDSSDIFVLHEPDSAVYQLDTPSIIQLIRQGIRYDSFRHLVSKSPFSIPEWSRILHLTERPLQRYKKENKSFDPLQSEKIIQIFLLYKKGIRVFGHQANFDTWLDTINPALGHIKPKDIFDSAFGIDMIQDELGRIEHGILA